MTTGRRCSGRSTRSACSSSSPSGSPGSAWMFKASRRLGYVMAAWLLPNLLIYTLYYWAPDGTGVGYLRFFLTIFPGLAFCALGAINEMIGEAARRFSASAAITFGVVTCLATLIGIQTVAPWMEDQFRGTLMLQRAEAIGGDHIPAAPPPGSVIFGPDHIVHYLQFVGDYVLYSDRLFTPDYVRRMGKPDVDPNDPTPFQAATGEDHLRPAEEFLRQRSRSRKSQSRHDRARSQPVRVPLRPAQRDARGAVRLRRRRRAGCARTENGRLVERSQRLAECRDITKRSPREGAPDRSRWKIRSSRCGISWR